MYSRRGILLVEDDEAQRSALVTLLSQKGINVRYAATPTAALAQAEAVPPAVLVTDIVFPGDSDGIELIRRFHAAAETKDVPVLMMTALADADVEAALHAIGPVRVIRKPFTVDELMCALKEMTAGAMR